MKTKKKKQSVKAEIKGTPVTPLSDRVLLRPLDAHEIGSATASGIIIPETVDKEKTNHGKVIAVGPGRLDEDGNRVPMSVKVGQKVIYSKYSGDELKIGDEEFIVVKEESILAILG